MATSPYSMRLTSYSADMFSASANISLNVGSVSLLLSRNATVRSSEFQQHIATYGITGERNTA